jgi:hypothetical protein
MKRFSFDILLTVSVAFALMVTTMPVRAGSSEASSQASSQAGSQAASESGGGLIVPPQGTVRYSPSGVYVEPPKPTATVAKKVNHKASRRVRHTVHHRQH